MVGLDPAALAVAFAAAAILGAMAFPPDCWDDPGVDGPVDPGSLGAFARLGDDAAEEYAAGDVAYWPRTK